MLDEYPDDDVPVKPTVDELRWVDPADVIPGTMVVVNVLWSPHPRYNEGNAWIEPPDSPEDSVVGSWSVGSWMVPSDHDDHPRRWSRKAQALALLFQERDGYLLVDTGDKVWSVPHGLASVVAVPQGVPTYADEDPVSGPCEAACDDGRVCSVQGPHPTHRTAYPFTWWENAEWRDPGHRGPRSLADLAKAIPSEATSDAEEIYPEG